MKTMTRIIQISVLLVATFSMSAAVACTAGAWNGGVTGNPAIAAEPAPETALPRVSGKCALTLEAAGTVKDTSPVAEPKAYIRFYVMGSPGSEVPIFEGHSDDAAIAGDPLFEVRFDATTFDFDTGAAAEEAPGRPGWNMIQLAWIGGTTLDYTVNAGTADEVSGQIAAAPGTLESVILGTSEALGGTLVFDDYEAHRETPVDGLLIGDSDNSGAVNVFDILAILKEINRFAPVIQEGTPDCNMDGAVNVFDILDTLKAINRFSPVPCNTDPEA